VRHRIMRTSRCVYVSAAGDRMKLLHFSARPWGATKRQKVSNNVASILRFHFLFEFIIYLLYKGNLVIMPLLLAY